MSLHALLAVALRSSAHAGSFLRGVLEKAGVEPQVKRIGKYKSAGVPRLCFLCLTGRSELHR